MDRGFAGAALLVLLVLVVVPAAAGATPPTAATTTDSPSSTERGRSDRTQSQTATDVPATGFGVGTALVALALVAGVTGVRRLRARR